MLNDHEDKKGETPSAPSYEIGYRKPPKAKQFKPGQSGNPGGRPPGARNKRHTDEQALGAIVKEVANTQICVTERGKPITTTWAKAIVCMIGAGALKGSSRKAETFLKLLERTESLERAQVERDKVKMEEFYGWAIEYKLKCEADIEKCLAEGRSPPNFLPKPEHIFIDTKADTVRIIGPMTKEEIPEWETRRDFARDCDEMIENIRKKLERARDNRARTKLLGELKGLEECKARALGMM